MTGPILAPQLAPYKMASIQKISSGYRAQIKIRVPGQATAPIRDSKIFSTRREALEWAAGREREIKTQLLSPPGDLHSLRDALRRYADEVSTTKRGARWEQVRLNAFEAYLLPHDLAIAQVTSQHIANFRDSRAQKVGSAAVLRELTLLSSVFQVAKLEWGWVDSNPCRDIRKPNAARHRERVLQWWEIRAVLREMKYHSTQPIKTTAQSLSVCMLLALRTGMRAGELCALDWRNVHAQYVHLPITKNGSARNVPLSSRARRLLMRMEGWNAVSVFGLKSSSLDTLFRRYRGRAGLDGFTWHDTRHTAATMLSKKVDVLTLCKIFGWSETRQALTYYNPSTAAIAAMLG